MADRPHVVHVAVVGNEEHLVALADARRMLDGRIRHQHLGAALPDGDQRPAAVAQAGHHGQRRRGRDAGNRFTRGGAVQHLARGAHDRGAAAIHAQRDGAAIVERRCHAIARTAAQPLHGAIGRDAVQVVVIVVVAADLRLADDQVAIGGGAEARIRFDAVQRFGPPARRLAPELGQGIAVALDVPARPVRCQGRIAEQPAVRNRLAFLDAFPAATETRAQPRFVFGPELVHVLARDRLRIAVHAERNHVAAVVLDEIDHRLGAVALLQEGEEVPTVEIVAVEGKAPPARVHFGKPAQPAARLGAHHALELRVAEAAVAERRVGLGVHRETLGDPGRLQRIRKQERQAAEHAAQVERAAARLVEVDDVKQLVREHEVEPLAVLQQLPVVGRREEQHRVVERQR